MSETKNTPQLRFKGFEDAWEERKIADIFEVTRGYVLAATQTDANRTENMPYPVYSSQTKNNGLLGYYKDYLYEDAITWTTDGANAGTVNYRKGKFYCTNVCGVPLSGEINAEPMIAQALDAVTKRHVSYVGNPKLMNNVMESIKINLPAQAGERKAISDFLVKIDELIAENRSKSETLYHIKSSLLEKMFPRVGFDVPEIRFSGFEKPWERRNFCDVFDCSISNNVLSRAELSDTNGSVYDIHYGDILTKLNAILDMHTAALPYVAGKTERDFKNAVLQDGDVVIADTAEDETVGKACELIHTEKRCVVAGLHTIVCRPRTKMAGGYLGYYINSDAYHRQLLPLMQGVKVLSISRANIQKTEIMYPTELSEQLRIAECFGGIDACITRHDDQVKKLETIKKSLLKKMFV